MREVIILKGIPASSGRVKGRVKCVCKPEEADALHEGEVLVAPEITPEYTLAILKAAAVVTDRGGISSHPAIIAREIGIPGVVGAEHATHILNDGMEVIVDGDRGVISREGN